MEKIIDQAVAEYQSQLEKSIEEFFKDTDELQNEGLTSEEILAVIAGLAISDYWLTDLQMQLAIDRYLQATGFLLDDMLKFGRITETQLLALRKMQESAIITYSTRLGEEVRLGLSEGLSQGLKGNALKERISSRLTLSPGRVEGIVGTTLATYNRSVTNIMAEDLPAETKWYYHGPLDEKTRPICRVMLGDSGLTQLEVERRYPGALNDGGGINCRHQWLPRQSDKTVSASASQQVKDNPKKFRKAKTLLEYARENT